MTENLKTLRKAQLVKNDKSYQITITKESVACKWNLKTNLKIECDGKKIIIEAVV